VDQVAQVEIRGETAVLRNVSGQPAEWRRFECSGPMPPNPAGFRFQGIDGRGRQTLIREPRNGPAVVQIEDPRGGREGYTFDITWFNGPQNGRPDFGRPDVGRPSDRGGPPPDIDRRGPGDADDYYRRREDSFRGEGWRRRFFDRIREDLEHVQAANFPRGGDEFRLERTMRELNDLQRSWENGRYDDRDANDVMIALDRVLRDNRLSRRDRDILSDDLQRLRSFRDRH
jgi:hypothetical protein